MTHVLGDMNRTSHQGTSCNDLVYSSYNVGMVPPAPRQPGHLTNRHIMHVPAEPVTVMTRVEITIMEYYHKIFPTELGAGILRTKETSASTVCETYSAWGIPSQVILLQI